MKYEYTIGCRTVPGGWIYETVYEFANGTVTVAQAFVPYSEIVPPGPTTVDHERAAGPERLARVHADRLREIADESDGEDRAALLAIADWLARGVPEATDE